MVMIDCLIEVAVFTVYALGGMGHERPRHAYSCIHVKDFVRTAPPNKPEQWSNLPPHFLKTKRK